MTSDHDIDEDEARIPTDTVVGAALRRCFAEGIQAYVVQRGDKHTGLILLVQHVLRHGYRLLMQTRDTDGRLGWMAVMGDGLTEDYTDIHAYVERARHRDPDLWIIEIETKDEDIPFEGAMFD
jgi:hypothetical protein